MTSKRYDGKSHLLSRRKLLHMAGLGGALAATGLLGACRSTDDAPDSVPGDGAAESTATSARPNLIVGLLDEPSNMFILNQAGDNPGLIVMNQIYDSLFYFDYEQKQLVPGLVTEWEQPDDLTFRFKLREGVQFHKGYGEFTAEDVEWNINETLTQEWTRRGFLTGVKEANAVDRYTVEVTMSEPFAGLLLNAMVPFPGLMVSKRAYLELGDEFLRNPIGTGAFEFVRWDSGRELILKRNEDYWRRDRPYLEEITFRFITDAFVRQNLLLTGEIDWMDWPDYKDVADLGANPDLTVSSTPGWNYDFINFVPDRDPWTSKEARQAVGFAVDRQEIVETIYHGHATPLGSPFPPNFLGSEHVNPFYPLQADPDRAKKLLAEAGLDGGFTTKCITSSKSHLRQELELVTAQLAAVGIIVEIEPLDTATFSQRAYREFEFEMSLEDLSHVSPDPDGVVRREFSSPFAKVLLNPGITHPELDEMLKLAIAETDLDTRLGYYAQAIEFVEEQGYWHYLAAANYVRVMNHKLKGFVGTPQDFNNSFQDVYWEA